MVSLGTASDGTTATDAARTSDPLLPTVDILVKALRALGQAGRPVAASQLAAQAWWALRTTNPGEAEHVNGAMHYLARLPAESTTGEDS